MRAILFILIIIAVTIATFAALNYFGFYIEWKYKFISVAAGLPIIKAIQTFLSDPLKKLKEIKSNNKN